jgi:hypothetical protein
MGTRGFISCLQLHQLNRMAALDIGPLIVGMQIDEHSATLFQRVGELPELLVGESVCAEEIGNARPL